MDSLLSKEETVETNHTVDVHANLVIHSWRQVFSVHGSDSAIFNMLWLWYFLFIVQFIYELEEIESFIKNLAFILKSFHFVVPNFIWFIYYRLPEKGRKSKGEWGKTEWQKDKKNNVTFLHLLWAKQALRLTQPQPHLWHCLNSALQWIWHSLNRVITLSNLKL